MDRGTRVHKGIEIALHYWHLEFDNMWEYVVEELKAIGLEDGMLKMIFSTKDHRLLGVHILGEGATELIHIGQAVLVLEGTLQYLLETVFNYPTLAEAYKIAALDVWNRISS